MELFYVLLFAIVAAHPKFIDRTSINFEEQVQHEIESERKSPSNADEPILSSIKLDRTSSYMVVDSTPCGKTIVCLLFNEVSRKKKKSYVVVSNNTGSNFNEYTTEDFDDGFEIDEFKIDHKFILLYSYRKLRVYIFDHSFNLISKTSTKNDLNHFYIHPLLNTLQASLGFDKTLSITVDSGKSWKYRGGDVQNFSWKYDHTGDYLIILKANTSDLIYQNAVKEDISTKLKSNAIKIISNGNKTFVIYKDNERYKVGVSTDYNYIRQLYIPTKYDIIDFKVSHVFKEEYMILATLSDLTTTLYQGNLKTYKFVRLIDRVKSISNEEFGRCYDVAYFKLIPGFILVNAYGFSGFNDASTLISFNHGSKWQRVKVGIYEDGKPAEECHLPSCSFTLHFDCTMQTNAKHNFIQSDWAPHILSSQGDYKINGTSYRGLFVSIDAGYTWHLSIKGTYYPAMINEGGILFGVPRISYRFYYSMSEGENWSYINTDYNGYIISELGETNISRTKLRLIGASWSTWYIYTLDFTGILTRECLTDDYTVFRPSSSSTTHCFMGNKYEVYKKKTDSICKNTLERMPPKSLGICQCSQEDFGCNYGHKMVNNLCIEDPEAEKLTPGWIYCYPGYIVSTPSAYASIAYDTCDKVHYNIGYKYTVCGLSKYNDFIAFIKGIRMGFFSLYKNDLREISMSIDFNFPDLAGTYTLDVSTGCIYYLTTKVYVRQACWGDLGIDFKLTDQIYLSEKTVTFLEFDPIGLNLIYSAAGELNIKSVRSGKTKVLKDSYTSDISFIRVVSEEGFILLGQHNSNYVVKINFNGSIIDRYKFTDQFITAAYDNMNKKIYGITKKGLYMIVGNEPKLTTTTVPEGTSDLQFFNGVPVFVTPKGVSYNSKMNDLKSLRGIYVKNSTSYWNNTCDKLACEDICYPTSSNTAECACPNNMKLVGSACKCNDDTPDCLKCKDSEFACEEGKCISSLKRCDGYVDCINGFDEYDCKIKCTRDQFACTSEQKCISFSSLCDGLIDCAGAEDEFGCKPITNCTEKQFTCNNKFCVPAEKKCDGSNDCGDYSDEDHCSGSKCTAQEYTCNDGSCIPLNLLCDNNMDCSNWDDEHGCHDIPEFNSTCYYKCSNDKCIKKENVCDRVADCFDGYDELSCGFKTECSPEMIPCKYVKECIKKKEICDGKYDCSDNSDEWGCGSMEYKCKPGFSFQCVTTKECIPISYYCDGINDCNDKSDEVPGCYQLPKVWFVYTIRNGTNNQKVLWGTVNEPLNVTYKVSLYDSTQTTVLLSRKVTQRFYLLKDLSFCQLYFITVEIVGHEHTKAVTSTKILPPHILSIKNALYKSGIVVWDPIKLYCSPGIYLVECKKGNDVKFRNFSKQPFLTVSSFDSCYVRVCPIKAVGPFCSDPILAKKKTSAGVTAAIVICTLILIAIVIAVGYFVYSRYSNSVFKAYSQLKNHTSQPKKVDHESELSDDEIEI